MKGFHLSRKPTSDRALFSGLLHMDPARFECPGREIVSWKVSWMECNCPDCLQQREKSFDPSVCLLRGSIVSCAPGHMCVQCGKAREWLYTHSVSCDCCEYMDV